MTAEPNRCARGPGLLPVLAAVLLLAACGAAPTPAPASTPTATPSVTPAATASPSASPSPAGSSGSTADAAVYRAIEDQVAAIRGLQPKARLEPTVLDEPALRARIEKAFDEENPAEVIRESEIFLKALGLLPADASLRDLYLELMGSQVAGFYDLEADEMFVVSRSGGIGPVEKATFAHEFVHALQDQHFGADRLVDEEATKGHGDRSLAWRSVVEGDASLVQVVWFQQHLTAEEIQQVLSESSDPEMLRILEAAPAILRETMLFPYTAGAQFAIATFQKGGWAAVDALYEKLPESTEQILHPDKYDAGEAPRPVTLPGNDLARQLGDSWTVADEDTLGEFILFVWIRERRAAIGPSPDPGASPEPLAGRSTAGWGGDRMVLLVGPDGGYAIVLATVWDTLGDAAEFATAARSAVRGLPGGTTVRASGDAVTVLLASDAGVLDRLEAALPE